MTGITTVGSILTCGDGEWDNGPLSYAKQWAVNGEEASGETADTFDTTGLEVDDEVTCDVVASNGGGDSDPETSNTIVITDIADASDIEDAIGGGAWTVTVLPARYLPHGVIYAPPIYTGERLHPQTAIAVHRSATLPGTLVDLCLDWDEANA